MTANLLFSTFQSVAQVAEDIWDHYGFDFGTDFSGLYKALSHINYNIRVAAAEALAAALDEHPDSIQVCLIYNFHFIAVYFVSLFTDNFQESLSTLFSLYIRDMGAGDVNVDAGWLGRQGIALALHSAADVLRTKDLPVVMTFLISRALVTFTGIYIFNFVIILKLKPIFLLNCSFLETRS